jgi:hypothetical protein
MLCHDTELLKINGEHCSVEIEAAEIWRQYTPQNIFNGDTTAQIYNVSLTGGNDSWGKRYKNRLTLLFCCNMEGTEKLRPLIAGKFQKPC